jgi:hypothetical protein
MQKYYSKLLLLVISIIGLICISACQRTTKSELRAIRCESGDELLVPSTIVPDSLGGKDLKGFFTALWIVDKNRNILKSRINIINAGYDSLNAAYYWIIKVTPRGDSLYKHMLPWLRNFLDNTKITKLATIGTEDSIFVNESFEFNNNRILPYNRFVTPTYGPKFYLPNLSFAHKSNISSIDGFITLSIIVNNKGQMFTPRIRRYNIKQDGREITFGLWDENSAEAVALYRSIYPIFDSIITNLKLQGITKYEGYRESKDTSFTFTQNIHLSSSNLMGNKNIIAKLIDD